MADNNSVVNFLEQQTFTNLEKTDDVKELEVEPKTKLITSNSDPVFFDISKFSNELQQKSTEKNRKRLMRENQNITGYDICHNCIQQVLFKLRNTPIPCYGDPWLPVHMRTEIGNAAHLFLQNNTKQFTETELNLKVPSIRFYGKIDFMVNDNVLGEIKTCPYSDYKKVLKTNEPRQKDYLQTMTYQYIIENYIDEIKSPDTIIPEYAGNKPILDKYNIEYLQFVYIAHDIISADVESMTESNKINKEIKQKLDSKKNPFFFITSLVIKLDNEIKQNADDYIKRKFDDIHKFLRSDTNPDVNNEFVDLSGCYFCPYHDVCGIKNS